MLTKKNDQAFFLFQLISFFFCFLVSFLFLFNIFLIHLLFRKKFTGRIVGKKNLTRGLRRKQAIVFIWPRKLFSYKTVLSQTNVKSSRMGSTKWSYPKEQNFGINYFVFWKILFHFKNLSQRVDLMYQIHKCPYSYFS